MTKKTCAKRAKTKSVLRGAVCFVGNLLANACRFARLGKIASLKAPRDFQTNPVGLPEKIVNNFAAAIKLYKIQVGGIKGQPLYAMFPQMLYNSVMYSVGCALINTAVTCITAYCCARYKYNLSRIVYVVVLVTMTIPIVGSLPSQIQVAQGLHIYNTIWGMWLQSASFLGLYFLVFYETFASLPNSFFEAARLDRSRGSVSIVPYSVASCGKRVFDNIPA